MQIMDQKRKRLPMGVLPYASGRFASGMDKRPL